MLLAYKPSNLLQVVAFPLRWYPQQIVVTWNCLLPIKSTAKRPAINRFLGLKSSQITLFSFCRSFLNVHFPAFSAQKQLYNHLSLFIHSSPLKQRKINHSSPPPIGCSMCQRHNHPGKNWNGGGISQIDGLEAGIITYEDPSLLIVRRTKLARQIRW